MVVYFSGTGNSRYCAQMLASKLGDVLVDSADYLRRQTAAELISEKPWVFVCPIYAWQMPRVFERFVHSCTFQGSSEAYFVLTCGGEMGGAADRAQTLCREAGLTYQGALEVVMPNNYIIMFNAPEEAEALRIISAAHPVLERGAACIREGTPLPTKKAGILDKLKSGAINQGFYQFYVKAKGFHSTDACVSCGKCAGLCPLSNIAIQNGKPIWGERCTHCMACICGCPEAAIEDAGHTRGKRRYWCPEYEAPRTQGEVDASCAF